MSRRNEPAGAKETGRSRRDRYVDVRGEVVVVRPAVRDRFARGAWLAFGMPLVVVTLGWTTHALVFGDEGGAATLAASALAIGSLSLALASGGLALVATASRWARKREVVIDLAERLVTRRGSSPEVFRTPDRVRVASRGLGWELSLEDDAAPPRPLVRAPRGSGRALARAARRLADSLEVEASVPRSAERAVGFVPDDPDAWAALCYAPLDGVNIVYSLFALLTNEHPRLRFAAKQSLVFLLLEMALAFLLFTCLGTPLAILPLPLPVEIVVLVLPLLLLGVLRMAARIYAAYRAHRGATWVMPWLAFVSRRWLPRADESAEPTAQRA